MDGIEERMEKKFVERLKSIDYCLEREDEETYNWERIKRELTAKYNYLTLEIQDKYRQRYKFQLDAIDMIRGEQRKEKCA